ncbi:protein of unknown function [Chryseolinea serpens]|uniref:DUF4421 domain-containing protein n=1 Tax=Chryseolinea serpens TaxID=947013 RepID=A0A1M5JMY3_9BACT|nr:DUF4421 family protein [Chryseolinea serpens]SHG41944.1 protein of unknown function [Chryseolinea serpens]
MKSCSAPWVLLSLLLAVPTAAAAQENVLLHPDKFYRKFFPHLRIRRPLLDTAYIKTYPNALSVGVHVLSPGVRLNLSPRTSEVPAASNFRTSMGDILGFSAGYRFVAAGFAFLLKSGLQKNDAYTPSAYRTATIKFLGSAYSFQFKYIRIKGFTDIGSINRSLDGSYRLRPDLMSKEFQFEGIYNANWKRYSYAAPITFAQRQVRSQVGLLLKAGAFYNQLSGDSAIITRTQQPYYDPAFANITTLRRVMVEAGPGVGGNLVFRRSFFVSFVVFSSVNLYVYKYLETPQQKTSARQAFVFRPEGRASIGYQSQRMYGGLRFEYDWSRAALQSITLSTANRYIGLDFGYRFTAPRAMKKFYRKTMPPGM